jgi:amidase
LSVSGVLTRGVADAAFVYDVLAPSSWDRSLLDAACTDPGPLRIGVSFRLGTPARVHDEVRASVTRVAEVLRALGHDVIPVTCRPGAWTVPFSIIGLRTLAGQAHAVQDRSRLEARTQSALRMTPLVTERMLRWAASQQTGVAAAANEVFDGVDLLLTPTMAGPPPRVMQWEGKSLVRTSLGEARRCPFTALWNFIGQPAVNVPAGFTASGLPTGVQLLARRDAEPTLIAIAAQLEENLRWTDQRPACR